MSDRRTYSFKIAGCVVELEQQWAVRIVGSEGGSRVTNEKALHYSKEVAVRAICERMGEILDKKRGLASGTGELLVTEALREELEGEP